ncbi:MAG: hypothetical protein LBD02_01415 [Christensenellaceae bacterium]|jgi:hypothetical protein|nr:hypothetical protein [Christensenellaceae bacterium]
MTVREAVALFDQEYPNTASDSQKLRWLNDLDGRVFTDVIMAHEHEDGIAFTPYDSTEASYARELLVTGPHVRIYLPWMQAQYDFSQMNIPRYNVNISAFQSDFSDFQAWYTRTHRSCPTYFRM